MPLIELLPDHARRRPYPLSWEEQCLLFSELSPHLARMALFKVNTGTREQEVVRLQWDWEIEIPELETSVFVVPRELVKNNEDRLIVLNRVARSVIDGVRDRHQTRVFTYRGRRGTRGPSGPPGTQVGQDHDRVLDTGISQSDRSF